LFGNKDYSIRVWLEPDKLSQYNITAREVSNAIANQNVQISAGIMGDEPLNSKNSFTYNLTTPGRLKTPEEFGNIVLRSNPDGSALKLKDVGNVELGSERYMLRAAYNGSDTAVIGIIFSSWSQRIKYCSTCRAKIKRAIRKIS